MAEQAPKFESSPEPERKPQPRPFDPHRILAVPQVGQRQFEVLADGETIEGLAQQFETYYREQDLEVFVRLQENERGEEEIILGYVTSALSPLRGLGGLNARWAPRPLYREVLIGQFGVREIYQHDIGGADPGLQFPDLTWRFLLREFNGTPEVADSHDGLYAKVASSILMMSTDEDQPEANIEVVLEPTLDDPNTEQSTYSDRMYIVPQADNLIRRLVAHDHGLAPEQDFAWRMHELLVYPELPGVSLFRPDQYGPMQIVIMHSFAGMLRVDEIVATPVQRTQPPSHRWYLVPDYHRWYANGIVADPEQADLRRHRLEGGRTTFMHDAEGRITSQLDRVALPSGPHRIRTIATTYMRETVTLPAAKRLNRDHVVEVVNATRIVTEGKRKTEESFDFSRDIVQTLDLNPERLRLFDGTAWELRWMHPEGGPKKPGENFLRYVIFPWMPDRMLCLAFQVIQGGVEYWGAWWDRPITNPGF